MSLSQDRAAGGGATLLYGVPIVEMDALYWRKKPPLIPDASTKRSIQQDNFHGSLTTFSIVKYSHAKSVFESQ